jgi:hypothetical protein
MAISRDLRDAVTSWATGGSVRELRVQLLRLLAMLEAIDL